jgi:hypothetical protein
MFLCKVDPLRATALMKLPEASPISFASPFLPAQGVDTRSLQHYLGHKNIQHTVTASFRRIGFEISGKTERRARGRVARPNLA